VGQGSPVRRLLFDLVFLAVGVLVFLIVLTNGTLW
jgi:hypothetical protein